MIEIDLSGPQGNAYALIHLAVRLAKEDGLTQAETDAITTKMTSGDYKNLLTTLEDGFPDETFYFDEDPRVGGLE